MLNFAPKTIPILTDEWGKNSFQLYVDIDDGDSSPNSNLYFIVGNAASNNNMILNGKKLAKVIEVNPSGLISRKSNDVLNTYTSGEIPLAKGDIIYTSIIMSYNTNEKHIAIQIVV